jgi:ribosome recycling factor
MEQKIKDEATHKMDQTVEHFRKDLSAIRTGRASLAIMEPLMVDCYGSRMPISQVATMNVPDAQTITIQPWDMGLIGAIEKAVLKSDLGLTPNNDGKMLRLGIPPLNEERRRQLAKTVKKRAEEAKVAIRNIRRDGNESLKRLEKDAHISEDETKRAQDEVQKITDSYIKKIDEILSRKEEEIMEV